VTVIYLLDTSILAAAVSRTPDERVVRHLRRDGAACAIPSPVWHELLFGVERMPAGKRRTAVEDFLRAVVEPSFPVLPYDQVAAGWHARERARLERAGTTAPFVDGQIAAVAFSNGLTLVTSKPRHFEPFAGLRLVDWTR
jgi:tRNA(fMet)-specific endonuclease VapC